VKSIALAVFCSLPCLAVFSENSLANFSQSLEKEFNLDLLIGVNCSSAEIAKEYSITGTSQGAGLFGVDAGFRAMWRDIYFDLVATSAVHDIVGIGDSYRWNSARLTAGIILIHTNKIDFGINYGIARHDFFGKQSSFFYPSAENTTSSSGKRPTAGINLFAGKHRDIIFSFQHYTTEFGAIDSFMISGAFF